MTYKFLVRLISLLCVLCFFGENISYANNAPPQGSPTCNNSTPQDPLPVPPPPDPVPTSPHDPVLLTGGKFYRPVTDVSIPGIGQRSLSFTRGYSSQDGFEGVVGAGWVSILDIAIYFDGSPTLVVRDQYGALTKFIQQSPTVYTDGPYKVEQLANGNFVYTLTTGDTYTFNTFGKPLSLKDPNGNAVTFNYTGSQVISLSDNSGRTLSFAYNQNGKVSELKDPLNRIWKYEYDTQNNLVSITDPLNRKTAYGYQDALDPHNITSVTDPMGYITSYEYNDKDQVTKQTKPDGSTIQFTFDNLLGTSSMIDEFGRIWSFEYVLIGLTTTVIDPDGGIRHYQYDPNTNLMISETDPLGHTTTYAYNNSNWDLIAVIDAIGNATTYTRDVNHRWLTKTDANGHTTSRVFDASSNITQIMDALGNVTKFTYDSVGQMISQTDALGHATTFTYDANGNLISRTDALGGKTSSAYDSVGRRVSVSDTNNNTTKYTYDDGNRVSKIEFPDGSSIVRTYDDNDRVLTQTDGNGNTTIFEYGSPLNESGGCSGCGSGQGMSEPISIMDALGNKAAFSYDAHGNRTSLTDANGNKTILEYGIFDRLIKITDALGSTTDFIYDLKGNLLAVRDANNHDTSFAYDALDRQISEKDTLGNETEYSYDSINNLIQRIDANGKTTTYDYDALNRQTAIHYLDNSDISFQYDAESNLLSQTDAIGVTNYEYDLLNRQTKIIFPAGKTISYAYDAAGNRLSMASVAGTIKYTYDSMNRLKTVQSLEGKVTAYNYDLGGRRILAVYPNQTKAVYTYDSGDRLTSLVNQSTANPSIKISSFAYTYDAVGNRLSMQDNEGAHTYVYDKLHRLSSATYPLGNTVSYVYDAVGNRLSMNDGTGTVNYAYDAANRLLSQGSFVYTYDANGNTISQKDTLANQTTLYGYDFENRLISVGPAANPLESAYAYDAFGRRIQKKQGKDITNFFYDSFNVLFQTDEKDKKDKKDKISDSFTYGAGIDEILSSNDSFYLYDGLGSVSGITDKDGQLKTSYAYDVFGAIRLKSGHADNDYLFTGRPLDKESGLYYYRNRYYSSSIGRFITKDPLGFKGKDVTLYGYVRNNPINMVDPSGLAYAMGGHSWAPSNYWEECCRKKGGQWKSLYDVLGYKDVNECATSLMGETAQTFAFPGLVGGVVGIPLLGKFPWLVYPVAISGVVQYLWASHFCGQKMCTVDIGLKISLFP